MKFIFSVFHYYSESESSSFIKKMRDFNFFCTEISDMYLDELPIDVILSKHNANCINLEIVLNFDLNQKNAHEIEIKEGDTFITYITFFDIILFEKIQKKLNKIYVSNEIHKNLLLLSFKNSWNIESDLQKINVKINRILIE